MYQLIDTHCHLDNPVFDSDRMIILENCYQNGINNIVVPGITAGSWKRLLKICDADKSLFPAQGLHPLFVNNHRQEDITRLEYNICNNTIVAIGEIGLDYYNKVYDRVLQIYYLENQLSLAEKYKLPVLLHVRKAHDDILNILTKYNLVGGIAHAYSGSYQQALRYISLGFKLGFGGVLTYERSTKIRTLAKELPLSSIVLETDAPDMTVSSHKGERNSPEYLIECLDALSQIRDESMDELALQTTRNAKEVLSL